MSSLPALLLAVFQASVSLRPTGAVYFYQPPPRPKPIAQYSWPSLCFQPLLCPHDPPYRSMDGSCNNLWYPSFGMANTTLVRLLPVRYSDSRGAIPLSVRGGPLPLARKLRTMLFPEHPISDVINSLAVMVWGQFLSHDTSLIGTQRDPTCCTRDGKLLPPGRVPPHCMVIEIPEDDEFYKEHGQTCIGFSRSDTVNKNGCIDYPLQQISSQTHFLDMSMVYGKTVEESNSLRSFDRGHLRVQEIEDGRTYLPNVENAQRMCAHAKSPNDTCFLADGRTYLPNVENAQRMCAHAKSPNDTCFLAGDVRVNQQPSLTAMHTLFLREHNLLADQLFLLNPHWSDEKLFQEARRILIAQYQHITYSHFLPLILGYENTILYKLFPRKFGYGFGYDDQVNPGTINMFTSAAFRSLHSIVPGHIEFPMEVGECPLSSKPLVEVLNRPYLLVEDGNLDSLLRGFTRQAANQMDPFFTDQITNLLFRPENKMYGVDLESIDIMRGRDHGLPSYNAVRKACGLRKAHNFIDFGDTMSKSSWSQLEQAYSHVDDVDLYVGGTMEDLAPGALVGPVFQCIVAEQFRRWRSGDRFFYEFGGQAGSFRLDQLNEIRKTTLSLLICRNSDNIERIQKDAFSQPSSRNSLVKCTQIRSLNLRLWKDPAGL